MSDPPVLPPRPDPPRRLAEAVGAWLAWFGAARLVTSALSVLVVVAGVIWLVRPATPTTEVGLPVATLPASAAGGAPDATLAPPSTTASIPTSGSVVVHVAGSVLRPGVHELPATARVHTAIEAAGGPGPDADLDGLNLAAVVADGQRIYVPVAGEVDPATVPSEPVAGSDRSVPAGPVDLNRATASELETLPGVGPATAAAIVDDRTRHGPFASVDELDRVPGIGPAKLAALRDLVTV